MSTHTHTRARTSAQCCAVHREFHRFSDSVCTLNIRFETVSGVNKDWTCKDKDKGKGKDKDQAYKDQDKDKDFTYSYLLEVAAKPTIAIKQQQ